jgi:hypothetical protein
MGLDVLMLRHCIKGFVLIKLEPEALKGDSARLTGGRCPLPSKRACKRIDSELGPVGPQTGGVEFSPTRPF